MSRETIFLYGPSGAGKNTVGRELAQALDLPFHDLDERIARRAGKAVGEIFGSEGEPAFRTRERQELSSLPKEAGGVIALGGGALLDPENRARCERRGRVLLLTAPLDVLVSRLSADVAANPRPLVAGDTRERLAGLLEQRHEHYASFALCLDTGGLTPEQAVWQAQVRLGMFRPRAMGAYDVRIRRGGLDQIGEMLQERGLDGPLGLVSDANVAPLYAGRVLASLESAGYAAAQVEIPAGEDQKTIATVARLWESFVEAGLERGSTVLALGGGVVSDLAGFAAATYLRGVRWAALPTTLLAMADASVGGKTGADLPQGKNLVGAFHPPSLVLADPDTLVTLPAGEVRSGLAECLKAGIIADPELFDLCASLGDPATRPIPAAALDEVVRRAMAVKLQVIEADPYEQGRRAVLNLGHTLGHAVELVSGYQLRHGEAVAIGLSIEAQIAEEVGLAEPGLAQTIRHALQGLGLPVEAPPGMEREAILRAMGRDKKRRAGKIRFALPARIGEAQVGIEVDEALTRRVLGAARPEPEPARPIYSDNG